MHEPVGEAIFETSFPGDQLVDLHKDKSAQYPNIVLQTPETLKESNTPSKDLDKDEGPNTGRWKDKEHQMFLEAYRIYDKNWKKVSSYVGTRDSV